MKRMSKHDNAANGAVDVQGSESNIGSSSSGNTRRNLPKKSNANRFDSKYKATKKKQKTAREMTRQTAREDDRKHSHLDHWLPLPVPLSVDANITSAASGGGGGGVGEPKLNGNTGYRPGPGQYDPFAFALSDQELRDLGKQWRKW
jgi:hypothetical protein